MDRSVKSSNGSRNMLALDEPVVVLTTARSGSTLLRLILNAHPELACPAETNILKICGLLGRAWQCTDPAAAGGKLSGTASASIRATVNTIFTDHLLRTGKRRWVDKSLGTVRGLWPFIDLYPKAKFICLHRHCLDVVDSGLEASPFGLLGYGFENFVTRFAGNSVAAIAAAWCEETTLALEFEESHPEQCYRIHYEQLAENPEALTQKLFEFLGAGPAPGIADRFFDAEHDFYGPGDHKVLVRNRITPDSVGRGFRVPADHLPPALLQNVNDLLARLGYAIVDDDWRKSIRPPAVMSGYPDPDIPDRRSPAVLDRVGEMISTRLAQRLAKTVPPAARIAVGPAKRIGIAAYGPGPDPVTRCWLLDLERGTVTAEDYAQPAARPRVDWLVTGEARTWLGVLAGDANVATSIRLRTLRCVEFMNWNQQETLANNHKSYNYLAMINHLLGFDPS